MAVGTEGLSTGVLYGRFSRRLRGVLIDFMLFLVAMVVALQTAIAFDNNDLSRVIGFGFMAGFFLYEPLMVWLAGGTVGHYLSNLRVVDDRTHGNVSFPKAMARVLIKAVLGWYSFISMAAARRHQAVHDLLTRSTVQVRDPAKALPSHYSRERVELCDPGMPSRARRIAVIALYMLGSVVLLLFVMLGLMRFGLYSPLCVRFARCSAGDKLLDYAVGLALLIMWAVCIGRGWRGRLWGARIRAVPASD
ncbi:MAG: RDD family protein [Hyphomicrobiaceae bacterium]|nr:RDD family protein [Hyphomicrobiaceae bacterium]